MNITPDPAYPVLRLVHMTFSPEAAADFVALFEQHQAAIAEMPGCGGVILVERPAAEGIGYSTVSRWRSVADLDAYRRSALFGKVWPATKRLFACPPTATSFTRAL